MTNHPVSQKTSVKAPKRLALLVVFALLAHVLWYTMHYALTVGALDYSVYRLGAMTVFNSEGFDKYLYVIDLLGEADGFHLPFTYPPFAAFLFVPLAILPEWVGVTLMMLLAWGVALWLAVLIFRYAQQRGRKFPLQDYLGTYGSIAALLVLILWSGPWLRGMALVQINPLIMLLVLWDFVRPATRLPRGFFVGIAGGIKLTPLAFGLILLMRKDLKGILTLGATFAATVLIGFIFHFQEAVTFWTSAVSDTTRVGNANYIDNVSIQGWLMHLGLTEGAALKVLHYGLILFLLVGVALLLPKLEERKMLMSQLALNAFLMISMSPVSWSHHNTWLPLMAAALWLDAFPAFFATTSVLLRRSAAVFAWLGVVGLWLSPMRIGSWLHGSKDYLEQISAGNLAVTALPMLCLFMAIALWILVGLKGPKKS